MSTLSLVTATRNVSKRWGSKRKDMFVAMGLSSRHSGCSVGHLSQTEFAKSPDHATLKAIDYLSVERATRAEQGIKMLA